jgi:hypothetical protein
MTNVELVDALALYLKHQPDCPKAPCTCGMDRLFELLIHRLMPSPHPEPDATELCGIVDRLWAERVPMAVR